ncbi:MAG TPA: zinc ribbon domain-containing protein [Terriglobia bacterium]|nr:zinc ribbon domain-containing protein [Terriglobia bacterium]
MSLGIALFIAAAMAVLVAAPLLTVEGAGGGVLPVDVTPLGDLKRRRMVIYENAQDLEFEFKAGKIAQNDYEALKQEYRMEAARLMADSQAAETLTPEEVMIEREVAERRARRKIAPMEEYVCEECGFENPLPVKFCGDCGAKISPRNRK